MMSRLKGIVMMLMAVAITISAGAQQPTRETGIKMYKYGKYQSAQNILAPLAANDPLANYYLGLSYLAVKDPVKANSIFMKYPDDPANISGTARVAFVNKDVAKGTQIAKDLAAKAKKKDWIQLKYAAEALAYSEGADYQLAKTWYTDALTKNDDADMHIGLGDTYRKMPGGGGEAMTNYEHVTEKDASNSLAFTRIGDLWYDARNYQSALDNYARAKSADSTNPLPYKSLADAYSRSGKYQLALQSITRYLELSDNTFNDRLEYARALFRAQSYCDAAKYAADLMSKEALSPENKIELTGVLGYSQAECGDSVEALKNMHTYFSIQNPARIKSNDYLQLAKLYMKLGLLDSAGMYYAKCVKEDTAQNKTDVYRQIAESFKSKKEYCKSADWYNNLVKANPETQPADYAWRSIMYYYCKDYTTAMNSLKEYVVKYPTQPSGYYWEGRVAAAVDSEATTGAAVEYYKKWFEVVGPSYEKKNELKGAYAYIMYYYFNKKDKQGLAEYKEKIRAIDPNDKSLKEIEEAEKSSSAPAKKPASSGASPAKAKK